MSNRYRSFSLLIILITAFSLRAVFSFINVFYVTLPQGGADAQRFNRMALEVLENMDMLTLEFFLTGGTNAIVSVGAVLYSITSPSMFVMGLFMSVLGTLVVYYVYKLVKEVTGSKGAGLSAAAFTAVFPQLILHSALFLRETPVNLAFLLAVYYAVLYLKRGSVINLTTSFFAALIAIIFHSGVVSFFIAIVLYIFLYRTKGIKHAWIKNSFILLVTLGFLFYLNTTGLGLRNFEGDLTNVATQFEEREQQGGYGESAYPEWLRYQGEGGELWKLPLRVVAFVLSPVFPYHFSELIHLLGFLDAFLYLYLFGYLFVNRKIIPRNQSLYFIVIVVLVFYVFFSFGVSNAGTAIRHRAKAAPLLIAAVYMVRFAKKLLRKRRTT
ncbi:Dolichyl-phosphate-mannose-protein mannosyltransferase [Cyclonatronum proteinivorum]|uniref:Dolichyl-phosphate-mannose-protein mannosyltransferase n=1 Tax=Cyclonatronum proteinivorum TaxID=1457365 RepID=A0A345UMM3_9BACT|nr:glycosyltransferase family 39 protein [Cyclonatronum proteinivorum]AXJ01725.1 Dolichyl-phosphate-mannose-protein mannosyltransferase [Cyclonatronum proteinivorum]